MHYLFVSILTAVLMAFATVMVAVLNTTVGQVILTVIATWVATNMFGLSLEDIPQSVWEDPWLLLEYLS